MESYSHYFCQIFKQIKSFAESGKFRKSYLTYWKDRDELDDELKTTPQSEIRVLNEIQNELIIPIDLGRWL